MSDSADYLRLADTAAFHAHRVAAGPAPTTDRGRFIRAHAEQLCERWGPGRDHERDDPGSRFCRLVADWWPDIAAGAGQELLRGTGLWEPLMCEWPMGAYAELAAEFLRPLLPDADVFEVGSGVGNLARLVAADARSWVRSDVDASIPARYDLPGTVEEFDLDGPPYERTPRADIVVAVNAAHCAPGHETAARRMRGLLRPGGMVVLAEGRPYTICRTPVPEWPTPWDTPWALTWTFGLLDGWWDRGGFQPRVWWTQVLRFAGLVPETVELRAGAHDLGGLIVGRLPT